MKCLKPFDVFISFAAEDRTEVADPIVLSLKEAGFRVWYSSDQLVLGESILSNVEEGLRQSRYGIVILSESYIKSHWATYELFALMARKNQKKSVFIPVWHRITSEEVKRIIPVSIIDVFGISTARGIGHVVQRLKEAIRERNLVCVWVSFMAWLVYKYRNVIKQLIILCLIIAVTTTFFVYVNSLCPPESFVQAQIREKIFRKDLRSSCKDFSLQTLFEERKIFDEKSPLGSSRHKVEFFNGNNSLRAWAALRQLGISRDDANIENGYGLKNYSVCLEEVSDDDHIYHLCYHFLNNDNTTYEITDHDLINENECHVSVLCTNFVHSVTVDCYYNYDAQSKLETIKYEGCSPRMVFVFEKRGADWQPPILN